jgi:hypothetical protein
MFYFVGIFIFFALAVLCVVAFVKVKSQNRRFD